MELNHKEIPIRMTPETPNETELKPCQPWHLGPAQGGENIWQDGDVLLIAVNTTSGWDFALVSITADEDFASMHDAETGDAYTAWDFEAIHYWIRQKDIPKLWNTRPADPDRDQLAARLEAERDRAKLSALESDRAHDRRVTECDTLMDRLTAALAEVKAAKEDVARIDAMADERIVDGIGDHDIDNMTLDAMPPDADPDNEEAWKMEWRKQFRVAVDKQFRPAALARVEGKA